MLILSMLAPRKGQHWRTRSGQIILHPSIPRMDLPS